MISLKDYIYEELILEADAEVWYRPNPKCPIKLVAVGHPLERQNERTSTAKYMHNETINTISKTLETCWSRLKKAIEDGKLKYNAPQSGESGSTIVLRSAFNSKLNGTVSFPIYLVKYHRQSKFYEFRVKTVFVDNEKNGKLKANGQYGQLEMFADTSMGEDILDRTDTRKPKEKKPQKTVMPKILGKIDLSNIPKR